MHNNWKPIQTAPKDGSVILGLLDRDAQEDGKPPVVFCYYDKRPILGEAWMELNGEFSYSFDCLTHWFPVSNLLSFLDINDQ